MAKATNKPGTTPATGATPNVVTATATNALRRAYSEADTIAIVTGDGARRTVRGLAVDRTMQAIVACGANPTVGAYLARFAPLCEANPLPGRSGQPGRTQASAILRWLEREGALVVREHSPQPAPKPAKVRKPKASKAKVSA